MVLDTTRNTRWTRLHAVLLLCLWTCGIAISVSAAAVDPSVIPAVPDTPSEHYEAPPAENPSKETVSVTTGRMTEYSVKVGAAGVVAAVVGKIGLSSLTGGALATDGVVAGGVVAKLQSLASVGVGAGAGVAIGAAVVGGASVVLAKTWAGRPHEAISALEPAESLGKVWVVATTEGWGSVYVARYETEDGARDAFGQVWCPPLWCAKMLFDPYGREMQDAGHVDRSDAIREVMRSNYFRAVYVYKEIGVVSLIALVLAALIYRLR